KTKPSENIPGLTQRVNKKGETVYEEYFSELFGVITNINIQSHEDFGDFIQITLNDMQEEVVLTTSLSGSYGKSFLLKTPNIDPTRAVVIMPYMFDDKETGKTRRGVKIYYEDDSNKTSIPQFWNKDN